MDSAVRASVLHAGRWRLWEPSEFHDGMGLDRLVRYIPDVARDDLAGLVADLSVSTPITDLKINGRDWAGTWIPGRVWLDYDREKRVGLFQALHKGGTTVADVRMENGCAYRLTTSWTFGSATIADLTAASSGVTYERSPVVKDQDSGRYSYSVTKRERLYQTIAKYTERMAASGKTERTDHLGVRDGDRDQDGNTITLPSLATPTAGKVVRLERSKNADCTQNIQVDEATPTDQTSVSEEHSAAADATETLHTEGTTIADKAAGAGTIRRVSETPTEAGNLRTVDRVITPKDQAFAGGEDSAAAATVVDGHTEGSALGALSATPGTIVRGEETPTEAGNYRTRLVTTTPKDQTSTSEEHSAAADATETLHTEGTTIADKAAGTGTIRRVSETPTEAGNVRTVDRVITPKDQAFAGGEDSAAAATVVDGHTEGSALGALSATPGTIVRGEETPTEAGNYRTRLVTTTPKDQTSTSEEHSAAADATETLHTEGTTIADKAAGAGTVRRVTETPTEAGNVRTVDRVITPKDQAFAGGEDSAAAATVIEGHTEGAALGAIAADPGTVVRGDETPTEAGNFRTRLVTITPKDQTSTSEEHAADVDVTETLHTEGTTIADKSAGAGTIRRVTETPTEAGNVRTVDRAETRKDQSISGVCVVKTPRMTSAVTVIDGAKSAPAALGAEEYGSISVRKDRYGRYVGEKRVDTYIETLAIPGWTIGTLGTYTINVKVSRQAPGGKWYLGTTPMTYVMAQHASESAAWDAITGGHDYAGHTSRVKALSNGQYISYKVTKGTTTWALETFP